MKPCGSNWITIEEAQLKISLITQTDSALNAGEKLSKNHGDLMFPDRVIAAQSSKKVLT